MRIFVCANINGRLLEFKGLLNLVKFTKEDKLILLGNYLYKGNYQREFIDYLIENKDKNIIPLKGYYEECYLKALLHNDFISEQKITSMKNVFYDYLDNKELRDKHLKFIAKLPTGVVYKKMLFTSKLEMIEGYENFISDTSIEDDVEEEVGYTKINFSKNLGFYEIFSKKTSKFVRL